MPDTNQETFKPHSTSQNVATFLVATLLFSLLYINIKVLWLLLIPLAIIGVIGLPKQDSAKLFKQRLAIFAIALISSFFIGFGWVTLK